MSEERYCEPCRRFSLGDLSIHSDEQRPFEIYFDHHLDHGSFEKAMQLPCLICTLAWASRQSFLDKNHWGKIGGCYHYNRNDRKGTLYFFTDLDDNLIWSSRLYLERLSSL